jgi:hypothetical protein
MLKNYFTVAFRSFWRNQLFSPINIGVRPAFVMAFKTIEAALNNPVKSLRTE